MRIPFQINSYGKDILGVIHTANKQMDIPVVIIMCYGLNGNRIEQHRMSIKLGEICEEKSLNLVRFDYANVGISEGDFFFSNIKERKNNVIDICSFIRGCFNKKLFIYLIGFSDGAKIAIQVQEHIKDINGLICWNPIIKIPLESLNENSIKENKLKIHNTHKKPYKPLFGVTMNTGILKEIELDDSINILENNIKKNFIFGEKDRFTKHIRTYIEAKNLPNLNINIIDGAGHLFSSTLYERQVNENTVKWILGE